MREKFYISLVISSFFLLFCNLSVYSQSNEPDTTIIREVPPEKYNQFYDSLKYKAKRNKFTQLFYDLMISSSRPEVDTKSLALDYYNDMKGKIISDIDITPLEVFGPSFEDTTRKAKSWLEKTANAVHTKSNLKTISKLLMFKVGDPVDPELMYENERIIRSSIIILKMFGLLLNKIQYILAWLKFM